jgi:hypothetical protein
VAFSHLCDSAESRTKQSSDDVRARLEKTFAKLGKEMPASVGDHSIRRENVEREAAPPRDPEELKRLHQDMISKQKDFISHRKDVVIFASISSHSLLGAVVSCDQSWLQWRGGCADERIDQRIHRP